MAHLKSSQSIRGGRLAASSPTPTTPTTPTWQAAAPVVRRDELHKSQTFSAIFLRSETRVTRPSEVLRPSHLRGALNVSTPRVTAARQNRAWQKMELFL